MARAWYTGELRAYRRVDGQWSGWVRFTTGSPRRAGEVVTWVRGLPDDAVR